MHRSTKTSLPLRRRAMATIYCLSGATSITLSPRVGRKPQGYHSGTPYLVVEGAPRLIDFLKRTFNAEERDRMNGPDGRVAHAELKIGDSIVMLSDATHESKAMPSQLYVYVVMSTQCTSEH